ncbi:MAG: hypothetical protein ACXWOH_13065 [Bdellovibrionota bacterium]
MRLLALTAVTLVGFQAVPAHAWAAEGAPGDVESDDPAYVSPRVNRSPAVEGPATGIMSFEDGLFDVDALRAKSLAAQAAGEDEDSAPALTGPAR